MPDLKAHLDKAESNFSFLDSIKDSKYYDWKVTVSFYTALHILNAYIIDKTGNHYRTHAEVEMVINPNNNTSLGTVDEGIYTAYMSLSNLSRRSRYMIHQSSSNRSNVTQLIYETHVDKAYKHLNKLLEFSEQYNTKFNKIEILNTGIKEGELKYFSKIYKKPQ